MLLVAEGLLPAEGAGADVSEGEGDHVYVSEGDTSESGGRRHGRHGQDWHLCLLLGLPQQG